jgi:hypothetical protein
MGLKGFFGFNSSTEGINGRIRSFHFNGHPFRGIGHPARQAVPTGQLVNKGPEPDALHKAPDFQAGGMVMRGGRHVPPEKPLAAGPDGSGGNGQTHS